MSSIVPLPRSSIYLTSDMTTVTSSHAPIVIATSTSRPAPVAAWTTPDVKAEATSTSAFDKLRQLNDLHERDKRSNKKFDLHSKALEHIFTYACDLALPLANKALYEKTYFLSRFIHEVFIKPSLSKPLAENRQEMLMLAQNLSVSTSNGVQEDNEVKVLPNSRKHTLMRRESIDVQATGAKKAWTHLATYHEIMETQHDRQAPLVQMKDYVLRDTHYDVPLSELKKFPPVQTRWSEETTREKQTELVRHLAIKYPWASPADAHVLQRIRYFLPPGLFSENALKTMSKNSAREANAVIKSEFTRFFDSNPTAFRYLFRYLFDQIFQKTPSREAFYKWATELATAHHKHLSYEDLHYVLFIHLHLVLTRVDSQDKNQILKTDLIDLLLKRIKEKKLVLDQARQLKSKKTKLSKPDLKDLKQQLKFFLSDQYKILIARVRQETGLDIYSIKNFAIELVGDDRQYTLKELIEEYLPGFDTETGEPPSNGCCVIS